VGKDGAHTLALFTKTITINLIGSFNMIRLAAEAMCRNEPETTGERGVMISTASVAAYDGQIGNMTIAPGTFGGPMLFGMPQEKCRIRWPPACPSPAAWAVPRTMPIWPSTSSMNDMPNGQVIRLVGAIRIVPK